MSYTRQVPVLVNDELSVKRLEAAADRLIGAECRETAESTLAGEDFAIYLRRMPGALFWLGSGPPEHADRAFGLHHPRFRLRMKHAFRSALRC